MMGAIRLRLRLGRCSGERGISSLEMLVAAVIAVTLAAIGVPTLHSRSQRAILDANVRGLAETVQAEMLEGPSYEFVEGDADAGASLSVNLRALLGAAEGRQRYVNPYAPDRAKAYGIVNSSTLSLEAMTAPPAVYITDNPGCRWEVFNQQSFEQVRRHLVGTLIVQFNAAACTIDVFFVDSSGNRSSEVERFPAI
jgi:type II secretory pathway pseudopilin PulG